MDTQFLLVYNGKYGGGRMILNPMAILNDGYFELGYYENLIGFKKAVNLFDGAKKGGTHVWDKNGIIYRIRKLRLENKSDHKQDLNIDGEALKWAYSKMSRRKEERKILMVISDGAPVDDSTLSTNTSDYLESNLKNTVKWIENKTNIELLAIGIGHDVTRYYNQAIKITDVQDLGDVMINQLTDLFQYRITCYWNRSVN